MMASLITSYYATAKICIWILKNIILTRGMSLSALSASLRPKTGFLEFVKSSKLSHTAHYWESHSHVCLRILLPSSCPAPSSTITTTFTTTFTNLIIFLILCILTLVEAAKCSPPQSGMLQPVSGSYCLLPPPASPIKYNLLSSRNFHPHLFITLTLGFLQIQV